jgi:hypothetical protein
MSQFTRVLYGYGIFTNPANSWRYDTVRSLVLRPLFCFFFVSFLFLFCCCFLFLFCCCFSVLALRLGVYGIAYSIVPRPVSLLSFFCFINKYLEVAAQRCGVYSPTGDSRFAPGSCCLVVSYRISSSCVLSLVFVSVANGSFAQHPYPAHVSRRSCSAVFIVARWIRFLNPAHVSSLCVCTSSACLSLFDFSIQHMLFTLSVFRRVHYSCRFLF